MKTLSLLIASAVVAVTLADLMSAIPPRAIRTTALAADAQLDQLSGALAVDHQSAACRITLKMKASVDEFGGLDLASVPPC